MLISYADYVKMLLILSHIRYEDWLPVVFPDKEPGRYTQTIYNAYKEDIGTCLTNMSCSQVNALLDYAAAKIK